jgi:hypothetical protein
MVKVRPTGGLPSASAPARSASPSGNPQGQVQRTAVDRALARAVACAQDSRGDGQPMGDCVGRSTEDRGVPPALSPLAVSRRLGAMLWLVWLSLGSAPAVQAHGGGEWLLFAIPLGIIFVVLPLQLAAVGCLLWVIFWLKHRALSATPPPGARPRGGPTGYVSPWRLVLADALALGTALLLAVLWVRWGHLGRSSAEGIILRLGLLWAALSLCTHLMLLDAAPIARAVRVVLVSPILPALFLACALPVRWEVYKVKLVIGLVLGLLALIWLPVQCIILLARRSENRRRVTHAQVRPPAALRPVAPRAVSPPGRVL